MNRFLVLMAAILAAVTLWASVGAEPTVEAPIVAFATPTEKAQVIQPATSSPVPLVHITQAASAPETAIPESRYADITLTAEDTELLAKIIWLEARGECFEGQQAVAEVVLNRMLSASFPDTLSGVVYQKDQFSTAGEIKKAVPGETQYMAIHSALTGPNVLPAEVVFFATSPENENVWGTIGGHVFCYPYYWEGE